MAAFIVTEDGRVLSFGEYLMLESFRPTPIPFGTNEDANNLEFNSQMLSIYTLFKLYNLYYCVQFSLTDGRVGFGASEFYSQFIGDYPDSPVGTKNAFKVFNSVFYILSVLIEKYNVSEFRFTGARDGLIVVYSKLHHNKFFINELNKLGFEYKGEDRGDFIYGRK